MKYLSINLVLILLISCFGACIPEPLDVEIPEEKPKIVISSQVLPDRALVVFLTKSFSSLQETSKNTNLDASLLQKLLIDKAYVTLSYKDKVVKLTRLASGIYATINAVQLDNETYTLYVKDSLTGNEATATTKVLPTIGFDSARVKHSYSNNFRDTTLEANLLIADDPNTTNYYMVTFIPKSELNLSSVLNPISFTSNTNTILLNDQNVGKDKKIRLITTIDAPSKDTIVATLFNVTKDYYEYQNSYKRSKGLFTQIIGEPITLPTNVKNGYGYFNMAFPAFEILYVK
jgi:Domain of unknown function (DUF4249)